MSKDKDHVVCSGYLTKSPTSGGRGRWRIRWVELVDSRRKDRTGSLRLEYFTSEKKQKNPLGVVSLEKCEGIRELRGGSKSRYTSAFSLLFPDRSDLVLGSTRARNIHRWMLSVKKCGIPLLVSIASLSTLTRSVSESGDPDEDEAKLETNRMMRRLPASPPLPVRHDKHSAHCTKCDSVLANPYAILDDKLDEAAARSEVVKGHYYSRAQFSLDSSDDEENTKIKITKRHSVPLTSMSKLKEAASLIVEPAPNLVALKIQIENFKQLQVLDIKKLKITSLLADGAFGLISMATLDTHCGKLNLPVIVKELKPKSSEEEEIAFLREAFIISQFNHPNIVQILGVVLSGKKMMVLDLLSIVSLREHIIMKYQRGKQSEKDMLKSCLEVALGMKHLHTLGYIHKHLKADHVLVSAENEVCKIAGFDDRTLKVNISSNKKLTFDSDEIWMAIEVLKKKQYSYQSDIWSYGVFLYEVWSMAGLPYQGFTHKKLFEFLNQFLCLAPPPGCPRPLYQVMLQCWYHKPSRRPTWPSILECLRSSGSHDDLILTPYEYCTQYKLPPESFKLGSSNLSSTKLMYKDLQDDYREVQKQHLAEVQSKLRRERRTAPANHKMGQAKLFDPTPNEDILPSPPELPRRLKLNPLHEGKQDQRISDNYDRLPGSSEYKSPRRSELFIELPCHFELMSSQSELNAKMSSQPELNAKMSKLNARRSSLEVFEKPSGQPELSSQSERYVTQLCQSQVSLRRQPAVRHKLQKQDYDMSSSQPEASVSSQQSDLYDRLPSKSDLCEALDLYESVPGTILANAMHLTEEGAVNGHESIHTNSFARQMLASSKVPGLDLKMSRSCDLQAPYESISHNILSNLVSAIPMYSSFSSAIGIGNNPQPVRLLVRQFESLSTTDPQQTSDTKAGHRRKLSFDSRTVTPTHTDVEDARRIKSLSIDDLYESVSTYERVGNWAYPPPIILSHPI